MNPNIDNMNDVHRMRLAVWNPSTGDEDELPPLPRYYSQRTHLRVVQLSVDQETKRYKVRIVCVYGAYDYRHGQYATSVYDSERKNWYTEWYRPDSEKPLNTMKFGFSYSGHWIIPRGVWSYDMAKREFKEAAMNFVRSDGPVRLPVSEFALTEGRVFRLFKEDAS